MIGLCGWLLHAATFMQKAYYRGMPVFLIFSMYKATQYQYRFPQYWKVCTKLTCWKNKKICSKACFGVVASIFYDYHWCRITSIVCSSMVCMSPKEILIHGSSLEIMIIMLLLQWVNSKKNFSYKCNCVKSLETCCCCFMRVGIFIKQC